MSDLKLSLTKDAGQEWDIKAFQIFYSMREGATLEELREKIFRKLGPRPATRSLDESPGTIHVLKKINGRRGWHKLKCAPETILRIWAMEYAKIEFRRSGWYDMKITSKGRKFLRDLNLSEEE